MTCPVFWFDDPRILSAQAAEFFPFTENDRRCTAAALNSFTRFGIYLGIVLAVLRMEWRWLLAGVVFAAFSVGAWYYMGAQGSIREGFEDAEAGTYPSTGTDIVDTSRLGELYVPDVIGQSARTGPTAANPFMNILMTEFTDNPDRGAAENVTAMNVRSELDSYFETMFASDPGDTFQCTQSQRQWVTQPVTTIPNDQDAFQNWLYRTEGRTCKEGEQSRCIVTMDNHFPWREIRSDR